MRGVRSLPRWLVAADFRIALTGMSTIRPDADFGIAFETSFLLLGRVGFFSEFDFRPFRGCGDAFPLQIWMAADNTSYFAPNSRNNRTVGHKGNFYRRELRNVNNSVGPKTCIAARPNWSVADYPTRLLIRHLPQFNWKFDVLLFPTSLEFLESTRFPTFAPAASIVCPFLSPNPLFRSMMTLLSCPIWSPRSCLLVSPYLVCSFRFSNAVKILWKICSKFDWLVALP